MGSKIRPEKSKGELSRPGKLQGGVKCALPRKRAPAIWRARSGTAGRAADLDKPRTKSAPAGRLDPAISSAGRKRAPSFCTSGTNRICLFFRLDIVVQIDYNVHSKTNRNKPIYTIYCILKIEIRDLEAAGEAREDAQRARQGRPG